MSVFKSRRAVLGLLAFLAIGFGWGQGGPSLARGAAKAKLETLEIATAKGKVRYRVEVVDTPDGRERGLMFRMSMPADHGMLFDFKQTQPVAFWMKNTFIPLDMVFIDQSGRIVSIAREAQPHDETPIPSGAPVLGVLEINGQQAAKDGIQVGDQVRHRIFHAP